MSGVVIAWGTDEFLKVFRQRLIDCRWQCLDDHIQTSERFSFYKKFKTSYEMEPYLLLDINRYVKCSLTRFRFRISDIFVHCMRYKNNVIARELMCPFCSISIENEVSFVLCCPGLDDLRRRYIHPNYFNFPSDFRLTLLLSTKNERTLRNLALYLYEAFNRWKIIMS